MPIYAYRCDHCGYAKDVLQKMSDPVLTVCPSCGQPTFRKQVTAAGFQLKGSGWYVTDFRGGKPKTGEGGDGGDKAPSEGTGSGAEPKKADAAPSEGAAKAEAPAPAPAPAASPAPAPGPAPSGGREP